MFKYLRHPRVPRQPCWEPLHWSMRAICLRLYEMQDEILKSRHLENFRPRAFNIGKLRRIFRMLISVG
jgi:hypothetical protein